MSAPTPASAVSDAFHNSLDGVLLARVEAGAVTLEAVNEGARTLLGLTPDAPLPDPAGGEQAWPVRAQPLARRLKLAAERGRATREQMVQRGPRGERIDLEVQLEPLPVGDGSMRVMAVLRAVPADESSFSPGAGDGETTVVSVGVFRTERGLGAVFVDDALLELLGLSHEQALGQGWLDAIHADDRGRLERALGAAVEREESVDVECRMLRDGVDERWARVRAVPMRGDDGRVTGCLGSIEDITDERISERAGARSTELAEAAHEIIGIVDTDWRIVYVNDAGRNRLGVPGDESFTSVPAMEFLPPEPHGSLAPEFGAVLARDGQWTGVARLRALDGSLVDVECTILRHLAPSGEVDHYSFLGRDVTEMRRIDRALLDSEKRFRLIAESSPDLLAVLNAEARVTYVSPSVERHLGYSAEELMGARMDASEAADSPLLAQALAAPAGAVAKIDGVLRHKDHTERWFEGSATNLLNDPVVQGIVLSIARRHRPARSRECATPERSRSAGNRAVLAACDFRARPPWHRARLEP